MDLKEKLANLPKKPGCYLMKNEQKEIIYVGKAKNLFNRVRSYFTGSHNAKTTKLVSQIKDFEYIITSTETEAFVLEINLIKKHDPKYNISLTDDKSYPYIVLTDEMYPRLLYTRDLGRKGKYYGPYPNGTAAREVVDLLNKIYPLRKCRILPKKECLYYHIGQCLAPCIKKIDNSVYKDISIKINKVLKGNVNDEIKILENKMNEASEKLEFEKAIEYLKLINDIKSIKQKQNMEMDINDTDIFGFVENEKYISIQIFHIRNNKMVERSGFLFELLDSSEEMFVDFITQFYLIKNNPMPKQILIPNVNIELLENPLKNKIFIPKKGKKKELVNLVTENALEKLEYLIKREEQKYNKTLGAVIKLGEILNIKTPSIIEAFDNSNIQGTSSVSGMVSYLDGQPNKKMYRKFKIKTVEGANDVATMEEVIRRRYSRLKDENQIMPDLVVVDGGKPQVDAAKRGLNKIGVNIDILGLVKNENHKTEALLFNDKIIKLDKRSNVFLFLESLQDEVHRYAITFHHQVHSKNTFTSSLDNIKGIGKVKKVQILKILGDPDFRLKLDTLNLTNEQKNQILDIYSSDPD